MFRKTICLAVFCACRAPSGEGARAPALSNSPGTGEAGFTGPAIVRVSIPVPATLPALPVLSVRHRREEVVRVELCPSPPRLVTALDWEATLTRKGYAVQVSDGGWLDSGPMALRFRRGDVIGDIYASSDDLQRCRNYIFRAQRMSGGERGLSWSTAFGDMEGFYRCVRFFKPDKRFPFSADSYSWGCK